MPYELFDRAETLGRGEFVRLALEEARVDYIDVARGFGRGRGPAAVEALLDSLALPTPPFAAPFLRDGEVVVAHVANILHYISPAFGLAPEGEKLRAFALGLQMTIDAMIDEFVAARKAPATRFAAERLAKYFAYFERVLTRNPFESGYSVGGHCCYVDLSLFQAFVGFTHALPSLSAGWPSAYPRLYKLSRAVADRDGIGWYLVSDRRRENEGAEMFGVWA